MYKLFTLPTIVSILLFSTLSASAAGKIQDETFKGKFDKIGDSFVCKIAYDIAVKNAYENGYDDCDQRYQYDLSTSIFNSDHFYCTAYAKCHRRTWE